VRGGSKSRGGETQRFTRLVGAQGVWVCVYVSCMQAKKKRRVWRSELEGQ
jgi:hypothetical protein